MALHFYNRIRRHAERVKTRVQISRLCREPNAVSGSLANALRETLENKTTPEEKVWIDRIEALRKERRSIIGRVSQKKFSNTWA